MRSVRTLVRAQKTSDESRYFICSLNPGQQSPAQLAKRIRGHWGAVENRNHWTRDHCFGEDRCRSRNPNLVANLALLRNALLLIVNSSSSTSTTEFIENCNKNPKIPLTLISKPLKA